MAALVNLGGKARHRLNFPANVPGHGGERSSFHHEEDPEQQVQYPIGNRGEICPEIDRKGDADKAARDTQPQSGNGLHGERENDLHYPLDHEIDDQHLKLKIRQIGLHVRIWGTANR